MLTFNIGRLAKIGLLTTLLMVVAVVGLASPTAAQNVATGIVEQQKLTGFEGPLDRFGSTIAVDGDTMIVGSADARIAAYVFTLVGDTWTEQQRLPLSEGERVGLGSTVAIDGDTVIIGVEPGDSSAGTAYVFTRTGTTWTQQQVLTPVDDEPRRDPAGTSVAIDGDTAVVSVVSSRGASGAAFVFTRTGATWTETQRISSGDNIRNDQFGTSLAIDGDSLVIAQVPDGSFPDALHVYGRTGDTWSETQRIVGQFGPISLAIDDDTLVVGSPRAGSLIAGTAYVYTRTNNTWAQQQELLRSDEQYGDNFGSSVAIDGNTVVVGANHRDATTFAADNAGTAYVFTRTNEVWAQQHELGASDLRDPSAPDFFGESVAIVGTTAIVGAPLADGVYVFETSQAAGLICNGQEVTVDLAAGDQPTDGDDVILGTNGPDDINAGSGNDTICGQDGDDTIDAGDGQDVVFGGEGRDIVNAGDGRDVINGGPGSDTINGGQGRDVLFGGRADDTIDGGQGHDVIDGGRGSDVISGGRGDDDLFGDQGRDVLRGNRGEDFLSGGEGNDILHGGQHRDSLNGNAGNDTLIGGAGRDQLTGGPDRDILNGSNGPDLCFVDNDDLVGQASNCEIFG